MVTHVTKHDRGVTLVTVTVTQLCNTEKNRRFWNKMISYSMATTLLQSMPSRYSID